MAQEVRNHLESLIPVGSSIELEYDQEREDRYGRTLAGDFHEGSLVNTDLAREGLGVAVDIAPNHKFYPEVLAAEKEASAAEVGISTLGPECFVSDPGFHKDLQEAEATIDEVSSLTSDSFLVALSFDGAKDDSAKLGRSIATLQKLHSDSEAQSEFKKNVYGENFRNYSTTIFKKQRNSSASWTSQ